MFSVERQDSAANLIEFEGFKQGFEITLTETLVALALDDLEEDRADQVFGEDLQQQALALLRSAIDHLTHNLNRGRMDHWAEFYERIFNFREIRTFDIEGQQTGLLSRAMTSSIAMRSPTDTSRPQR